MEKYRRVGWVRRPASFLSIWTIVSILSIAGCADEAEPDQGTEVDVNVTRGTDNPTPGDRVESDRPERDTVFIVNDTTEGSDIPVQPRVTWQLYTNNRFRYSVEWPANVLEARGEADNGDGQEFTSPDGAVLLRVFGRHVAEGIDIKDIYRERLAELSGDEITYERLSESFYVVSGYRDGAIFYEKTLLQDGVMKRLWLRYPRARKAELDRVVERISGTFGGV